MCCCTEAGQSLPLTLKLLKHRPIVKISGARRDKKITCEKEQQFGYSPKFSNCLKNSAFSETSPMSNMLLVFYKVTDQVVSDVSRSSMSKAYVNIL